MKIEFDFEYDCGGHVWTRTVEISKSEFEQDKLLVLVCSYMGNWCGYPGKDIDEYLHKRFPNQYKWDDTYYGNGRKYNVYNCRIEGFNTNYQEVALHLIGISDYKEIEEWIKTSCRRYFRSRNKQTDGKDTEEFSIWKN